jgi:hypothetical protein
MVMYLVQCGGLGAKLKPACHSSGIFSIVDLWSDFFPKQKKEQWFDFTKEGCFPINSKQEASSKNQVKQAAVHQTLTNS